MYRKIVPSYRTTTRQPPQALVKLAVPRIARPRKRIPCSEPTFRSRQWWQWQWNVISHTSSTRADTAPRSTHAGTAPRSTRADTPLCHANKYFKYVKRSSRPSRPSHIHTVELSWRRPVGLERVVADLEINLGYRRRIVDHGVFVLEPRKHRRQTLVFRHLWRLSRNRRQFSSSQRRSRCLPLPLPLNLALNDPVDGLFLGLLQNLWNRSHVAGFCSCVSRGGGQRESRGPRSHRERLGARSDRWSSSRLWRLKRPHRHRVEQLRLVHGRRRHVHVHRRVAGVVVLVPLLLWLVAVGRVHHWRRGSLGRCRGGGRGSSGAASFGGPTRQVRHGCVCVDSRQGWCNRGCCHRFHSNRRRWCHRLTLLQLTADQHPCYGGDGGDSSSDGGVEDEVEDVVDALVDVNLQ